MRLMISVIIVLLSVYGSNAQTVVGAACTTEGEKTPTSLGCDFYHLCEALVIVNRRCPTGETFNVDTMTCSKTFACTITTMAPTAPVNVPTAATGTGGSLETTASISETTPPASETTPPASGTTTPPANVPTVPTVTPPPATPPPQTTQTTQTTAPGSPTTQPTPPGGSLWPTGPITCTVAGPTYHGHHIRCDQFQICSNGEIFLRTCPSGQHWAPTLTRCDWPNVARCPHPL